MCTKARSRPRREEVRVAVAQVHRLLADNLAPGSLRASPADCAKFVDFVLDTLKFLNSSTSGTVPAPCNVLPQVSQQLLLR